jgi:hypothetical protein
MKFFAKTENGVHEVTKFNFPMDMNMTGKEPLDNIHLSKARVLRLSMLQKVYNKKVEPWMHGVLVSAVQSTRMGAWAWETRLIVYVWDTREILDIVTLNDWSKVPVHKVKTNAKDNGEPLKGLDAVKFCADLAKKCVEKK